MTRGEYESAYFTLLRALEELDALQRYDDYLGREDERLVAFTTTLAEAAEPVPRKVRRPVDATTKGLLEAVGRRRSVIAGERRRMADRLTAAQEFVAECESEVASLRA